MSRIVHFWEQDDADGYNKYTPLDARAVVFAKGWLEVEDIYRKAGWKVKYDKPAYSENYPATFKFERSRNRRP